MRFRTSSPLPPHLDPQWQRRLIGGVALVAVTLIALQLWFSKPQPKQAAPVALAPLDAVNFEVRDEPAGQLGENEFRSFGELDDAAVTEAPPPAITDTRSTDLDLDPALLTPVKDNTLGVRHDEADAFFYGLEQARRVEPKQLEAAAVPGTQYINLMTEPARYRGKPVTVTGTLRRLYDFRAEPNSHRLQTLYEAWLLTGDSGNHPVRVVASSIDPALPVGELQQAPVRVTGYFFKREGYNTPGGLHVAPTLLASRLEALPSSLTAPAEEGSAPGFVTIVIAISLVATATLLSFALNDRPAAPRGLGLPTLTEDAARKLVAEDFRPVAEQLRELEDLERRRSWTSKPSAEVAMTDRNGHTTSAHSIDAPTSTRPARDLGARGTAAPWDR